jgi:hypothetical protein
MAAQPFMEWFEAGEPFYTPIDEVFVVQLGWNRLRPAGLQYLMSQERDAGVIGVLGRANALGGFAGEFVALEGFEWGEGAAAYGADAVIGDSGAVTVEGLLVEEHAATEANAVRGDASPESGGLFLGEPSRQLSMR